MKRSRLGSRGAVPRDRSRACCSPDFRIGEPGLRIVLALRGQGLGCRVGDVGFGCQDRVRQQGGCVIAPGRRALCGRASFAFGAIVKRRETQVSSKGNRPTRFVNLVKSTHDFAARRTSNRDGDPVQRTARCGRKTVDRRPRVAGESAFVVFRDFVSDRCCRNEPSPPRAWQKKKGMEVAAVGKDKLRVRKKQNRRNEPIGR